MALNREKIEAAINQYKKFKVNLVQATLKEHYDNSIFIYFDGSFCETYGYYDYYEDLQVLIEDEYSIKSKIKEIEHWENGNRVRFQLL